MRILLKVHMAPYKSPTLSIPSVTDLTHLRSSPLVRCSRYRDRQEVFSTAIKILLAFSTDAARLQHMSTLTTVWARLNSVMGILERKNKLNAKLASKGKAAAATHADTTRQIQEMQEFLKQLKIQK